MLGSYGGQLFVNLENLKMDSTSAVLSGPRGSAHMSGVCAAPAQKNAQR